MSLRQRADPEKQEADTRVDVFARTGNIGDSISHRTVKGRELNELRLVYA
jgi:hypothetical protein